MDTMSTIAADPLRLPAEARDFWALTKPGVMRLVLFTALAGLLAAPGHISPVLGLAALLAVALGTGACGALNQWYEIDLDARMRRTRKRPLPDGRMDADAALAFGIGLAGLSLLLMYVAVNALATLLLALSILFYVGVYTVWLKRRTPQNIVIGGAAGAFPFLIGWTAVTGSLAALPLLIFLLVFLWTPPHFWSLALFVEHDYAAAGVPMLPVVAGHRATRRQVLTYAVLMAGVAVAPWPLGLTGWIYGVPAALFSAAFLVLAAQVCANRAETAAFMKPEKRLFAFSILYLFVLTAAVALDRMLLA